MNVQTEAPQLSSDGSEINKCSVAINRGSDESAAREVVHDRAHDRICGDSFEQRRAAGDDRHADHQDCADDRDDLFDALLARADAGDMLADARAAVGAYSAALDDQIGVAFGAFYFGSQRHRGSAEDATRYGIGSQGHLQAAEIFHSGPPSHYGKGLGVRFLYAPARSAATLNDCSDKMVIWSL